MNCSSNTKRHKRNRRMDKATRSVILFLVCVWLFGALIGFMGGRVSAVYGATGHIQKIQAKTNVEPMESMKVDTTPAEPEPEWVTYRITAYCSCEICCGEWAKNRPNGIVYGAAGVELEQGVSCASPLPFGTMVEIEGLGTYVVHDRMAQWVVDQYGEALIDLYFSDHEAAKAFGLQYLNVNVKGVAQNDPV